MELSFHHCLGGGRSRTNKAYLIFRTIYQILRRRQWHPTPVLLPRKSHGRRSLVGCSPWGRSGRTRLSDFTFTFHFHVLEKEMATHSSVFAWRIPGMGKPGGLPSMGSHRVGHDWSDLAAAAAPNTLISSQFCGVASLVTKIVEWMNLCAWSSIAMWNRDSQIALT